MLGPDIVMPKGLLSSFLEKHNFEMVKKLSDGTNNYGDVLLIKDGSGVQFALKIIHKTKFHKGDFQIASMLKHDLIMQTYSMEEINDFIFILTEFIKDGSLQDYIRLQKKNKETPDPEITMALIEQILTVVEFLHHGYGKKILHRDLKSANVLLLGWPQKGVPHAGVTIKLCDFGLAREIKATMASTPCGTAGYKAPEVQLMALSGGKYDETADNWSIGVILYELATLRLPFTSLGLFPGDTKKPLLRPPSLTSPAWDCVWCLIVGLLQVSPLKRLTCTDALKILREEAEKKDGVKETDKVMLSTPPCSPTGPVADAGIDTAKDEDVGIEEEYDSNNSNNNENVNHPEYRLSCSASTMSIPILELPHFAVSSVSSSSHSSSPSSPSSSFSSSSSSFSSSSSQEEKKEEEEDEFHFSTAVYSPASAAALVLLLGDGAFDSITTASSSPPSSSAAAGDASSTISIPSSSSPSAPSSSNNSSNARSSIGSVATTTNTSSSNTSPDRLSAETHNNDTYTPFGPLFLKNEAAIRAAVEAVRSDGSDRDFLVIGYAADRPNGIELVETGTGGLKELKKKLVPSFLGYALLKIAVGGGGGGSGGGFKFIQIAYTGEKAPMAKKGKMTFHTSKISELFVYAHVAIQVTSGAELVEDELRKKVLSVGGGAK